MFEGAKILVTGGAGFIGSHLVERLVEAGASVTSLDCQPKGGLRNLASVLDRIATADMDFVSDDLRDFMADQRFELAFHLAASAHVQSSVDDPRRDLERNAVATLNLLEAVRRVSPGTRLIYTSSAVVYRGGGADPIGEEDPTNPNSPYGVSKLAAERYVNVFARLFGLRTAVARLFTVFGPRLRKQIVYEIVGRLRQDGAVLSMLGDGAQARDFSYVSDVVDALMLIAARAPLEGEAYNVASGHQVTVDALARLIASTMGLSPRLAYSGAAYTGDTARWIADLTRLKALGFRPQVSFAEGIDRTVTWILENEPARSGGEAGEVVRDDRQGADPR